MNSFKAYIIIFTILSLSIFLSFLFSWPDKNLHYIQCDVGQGDAILITQEFKQILIDSGDNDRVVTCLTKHLPFWDKNIELVISSHSDKDHSGGFDEVVTRYKIDQFYYNGKNDSGREWQNLISLLKSQGIRLDIADMQILQMGDIIIKFLWPQRESSGLLQDNQSSVVNKIEFGHFSALLTGDIDYQIENDLIRGDLSLASTVLKVSHHGSKYSSSLEFIEKVNPQLAVIGVGKNSYGHPNHEVLQLLQDKSIQILRTDQIGDVEIVSDGQNWWLKR